MIVKLHPALKSYVWGGIKLKSEWGKVSDLATLSESWELSCHPDGPSVVASGRDCGKTLAEVLTNADLGANCRDFPFFPVLNKLIDSKTALSIQVHPSDEFALANEGQFGKTEMWHILSAEKDAYIYLGCNRNVSPDEFARAIEQSDVCALLNKVPVKAGDTYFIPSGTIHAIGAGVTLFEVQQNSSLTYRVYDYDRVGADGKKRPLHVEKAKKVANLCKYEVPSPQRGELLGECKYFSLRRLDGERTLEFADTFASVTAMERTQVGDLTLEKGETAFVSAGERTRVCGKFFLTTVPSQN